MIEFDDNEIPIKRLFNRLSTIPEDSQEDIKELITDQSGFNTSKYNPIEPIKGISCIIFIA